VYVRTCVCIHDVAHKQEGSFYTGLYPQLASAGLLGRSTYI
jgi:hypothetical protein